MAWWPSLWQQRRSRLASNTSSRLQRLPRLEGQNSPEFKRYVERCDTSYEPVNKYRCTIGHLVFKMGESRLHTKFDYQSKYRPAWAWALMVDSKTLPDLQTLVLDIRGYSYQQLQDPAFPIQIYDEQLMVGAEGMKRLILKSLIISSSAVVLSTGVKESYKEDGRVISPCHCTRWEAWVERWGKVRQMVGLFLVVFDYYSHP